MYADALTDNIANAERELAHAENVANRDRFSGDRDAYVSRHVAIAQAYATLAIAEVLARIHAEMAGRER